VQQQHGSGRLRDGLQSEPVTSLKLTQPLAALAQGLGDQDWSAIARISFQSAGLEKAA
jgi:hypothetical protein